MTEILQVLTIAGAIGGATWALRTKLGDIELVLKEHVTNDSAKFQALEAKVTLLEGRTKRR
jgi:hypothetical protein